MRSDEVRSLVARFAPDAVIVDGDGDGDAWSAAVFAGDEARAATLRIEARGAAPDLAASIAWLPVERLAAPASIAAYARRMRDPQPETALETIVATAWHEALGVAPASIDEDFFAAGGHSLLASDIAARLEDLLGIRIELTMIFDHPTVREQASWLAARVKRHPPLPPSSPATPVWLRIVPAARVDLVALRAALEAIGDRFGDAACTMIELADLRGAARRASWARAVAAPLATAWRATVGIGRRRDVLALVFDARRIDATTARMIEDALASLPVAAPPSPSPAARATVDPDATLDTAPPVRCAAISARRARDLVEAGRRSFGTIESTLVATIAIALARELGVDRVTLGIPASLRATRDEIGARTAIAPVAIDLTSDPSFARIVERTQTAACRARAAAAGFIVVDPTGPIDALVEVGPWAHVAAPNVVHAIASPSSRNGTVAVRATHGLDVDALEAQLDALARDPDAPLHFGALVTVVPDTTATDLESAPLPMTHAQERLWFLEELSPGSTLNHLQRTYKLDGALDGEVLVRALHALAARHDALRTRFVRVADGTPRQIVVRDSVLLHEVEELGDRSVASVADLEYDRIFALDRAPLWRTRLVAASPTSHYLLFTIHHLIVDALSVLIWLRELAELYHSIASNTAPHLPRIGSSVAELAAWERSDAGRARIANDLAFWTENLAGATPMPIPLDYRRPTSHGLGRHEHNEILPSDRTAELRAIGRFHGATLNTALIAAAFAFLARSTERDDLVCVVPAARRDAPGRTAVIGLLLNLLPLRVKLDGDPSFHEIVARTNRAMRDAFAHVEAPFERVVGSLGLAREPGRQPLFDVILNMVPGADRYRKGDLRFTLDAVHGSTQPCDMVIGAATRIGGTLNLVIRCRDDLFSAATARRMVRRFVTMLRGAIENPDTTLSALPMMPDDERQLSLVTWNATATPLPDATVHDLVVDRLRAAPEAIAILPSTTARELDERSRRFAAHLVARGIAPGTRVGIAIPPSPELAIAALGTMRAGAVYAPLDATQPAARFAQLASQVAIVIDRLPDDDPRADLPRISPDDPAYAVFTSGSTGVPKGVATTHRALVNQLVWFARDLPWQPNEVASLRSSPAFVDSLWELFGALADGVPLAIASHAEMLDPRLLVEFAARHRVTRMVVVPSLLQTILALGAALPDLRLWLATSEELKPSLVRTFFAQRPNDRLVNLYGASETADQIAAFDVRAPDPLRTPIGTPIANSRLFVLDPHGRPQPIGVPGELCVAGIGVSPSYLDPAIEPHKFVASAILDEKLLYRTGDRGRWRHDGVLEYLGRVDHVVKVRGIRVDPAEIEAAILAHPDIAATVVVATPGFDGENRLVAYIVCPINRDVTNTKLEPATLRAHLRTKLPETIIPTSFVALDTLPLGPTGKVDRAALPSPIATIATSRAPRGAIEHAVASAWENLLGRPVGAEDDFFAAGGQSLIAAQLGARLAERFAIDIPLQILFERPTIAAQAAWIESSSAKIVQFAIPRVPPGTRVPLGFAQERMWFAAKLATAAPAPKLRLALRITGPLDIDRLEAAMRSIATRHGSLRTIFHDGNPVTQEVVASLPRDHLAIDVTAESEIADHVAIEKHRAFDLSAGPPWRTRLLRFSATSHVLLVTTHHLVIDGLSTQIWLDELDAFYGGTELEPLALSAIDVIAWQRQTDDRGTREYWKRTLAGAKSLELPDALPRTAYSNGATGIVRGELSVDDATRIAIRAREADTTPFAVLLAAAARLFGSLASTDDVIIGTIAGGRDRPELRPLVGLFLNPLPIRLPRSGDLRVTGDAIRGALAHGDLPFEQIVAEARPERRAYRQPLFDIVHNHHPPATRMRLGDLPPMQHVKGVGTPVAPYEIMIRTIEHARGITVRFDFQEDRYTEATIRAWHARYIAFVRS